MRPARSDDAAEIARIQVDTWRTGYRDLLPAPIIESLSAEAVRPAWTEAVEAPPTDQHHVLVALEQRWLVGFAAVAPVDSDEEGIADVSYTAQIAPLLAPPMARSVPFLESTIFRSPLAVLVSTSGRSSVSSIRA